MENIFNVIYSFLIEMKFDVVNLLFVNLIC